MRILKAETLKGKGVAPLAQLREVRVILFEKENRNRSSNSFFMCV